MRDRSGQCDMSDTLTSYLGICDLYTAAVTDNTLITVRLELSAPALPCLCRTEDALAEETIPLRAERAVIDCLRLLYLAI